MPFSSSASQLQEFIDSVFGKAFCLKPLSLLSEKTVPASVRTRSNPLYPFSSLETSLLHQASLAASEDLFDHQQRLERPALQPREGSAESVQNLARFTQDAVIGLPFPDPDRQLRLVNASPPPPSCSDHGSSHTSEQEAYAPTPPFAWADESASEIEFEEYRSVQEEPWEQRGSPIPEPLRSQTGKGPSLQRSWELLIKTGLEAVKRRHQQQLGQRGSELFLRRFAADPEGMWNEAMWEYAKGREGRQEEYDWGYEQTEEDGGANDSVEEQDQEYHGLDPFRSRASGQLKETREMKPLSAPDLQARKDAAELPIVYAWITDIPTSPPQQKNPKPPSGKQQKKRHLLELVEDTKCMSDYLDGALQGLPTRSLEQEWEDLSLKYGW